MEEKEENNSVVEQVESAGPEQGKTVAKEMVDAPEAADEEVKKSTGKPEKKEGKKPSAKEMAQEIIDKIAKEKADKREFLRQYIERYPGNKTFHVTGDNMVFLEKDLSLARLHQKTLSEGSVTSIKVNV